MSEPITPSSSTPAACTTRAAPLRRHRREQRLQLKAVGHVVRGEHDVGADAPPAARAPRPPALPAGWRGSGCAPPARPGAWPPVPLPPVPPVTSTVPCGSNARDRPPGSVEAESATGESVESESVAVELSRTRDSVRATRARVALIKTSLPAHGQLAGLRAVLTGERREQRSKRPPRRRRPPANGRASNCAERTRPHTGAAARSGTSSPGPAATAPRVRNTSRELAKRSSASHACSSSSTCESTARGHLGEGACAPSGTHSNSTTSREAQRPKAECRAQRLQVEVRLRRGVALWGLGVKRVVLGGVQWVGVSVVGENALPSDAAWRGPLPDRRSCHRSATCTTCGIVTSRVTGRSLCRCDASALLRFLFQSTR